MAFTDEASVNISVVAGEALTIHRFVDFVDASDVVNATMTDAAANDAVGIVAESVATGIVAPIAISGVFSIELGATLTAGDRVSSGTNGVAAAASTTGDEVTCGPILKSGVSGDVVPILINFRTVDA